MPNKLDETLPDLNENQSFNCNEGCGECQPVEFDFCYHSSTNLNTGETKELTHRAYKSSCCGGMMSVWDETLQDILSIDSLVKEKS